MQYAFLHTAKEFSKGLSPICPSTVVLESSSHCVLYLDFLERFILSFSYNMRVHCEHSHPLHGIFFIPEKEDQRFIGLINALSYYFLVMILFGTSELRSELGLTILSFFTSVFLVPC